jgi:hypothetical protein
MACLKVPATAPLRASSRARLSRLLPLTLVKSPAAYTADPLVTSALTRPSAVGAQGSRSPVRALTAASRVRATALPRTTAAVKSPPT